MSVKLTDAQLVMMSAAAQREDRCLAAPETMKGAVVSKAGAKLVKLGFAREILAKPGTPLWRRDETGRSFALKLTAAGLKAMAVDERPQVAIEPGEASQPQLLPEAKNGVSLDGVGRHAPTAAPRDGSKLALMIDLLRRADGATIVDLTQATGWLRSAFEPPSAMKNGSSPTGRSPRKTLMLRLPGASTLPRRL